MDLSLSLGFDLTPTRDDDSVLQELLKRDVGGDDADFAEERRLIGN